MVQYIAPFFVPIYTNFTPNLHLIYTYLLFRLILNKVV